MSRAQATEVSSPLSLFPFIGVLLSTMGALLVVLICVSRSARDTAVREAVENRAESSAEAEDLSEEQLEQIRQQMARLDQMRGEAELRLRDDQRRLSHLEDHMRRLREKLQSLQLAAIDLESLKAQHLNDHSEAQREAERLEKLVGTARETVGTLKDQVKNRKRSYAIIPYEGSHGTQRRPIYIECRREAVILQPEGIRLTPADFRPPLGAGNPLAAALRATREYVVRHEGITPGKDLDPYPLILVRPDGILAYYQVREAIETWDSAFGYELIDADWSLEYPAANPQLAMIVTQAVDQSRTRQQMLVAAAPRAYGPRNIDDSESFDEEAGFGGPDDEDEGEEGYSGGGWGGGNGEGGAGGGYGGDGSGDGYAEAERYGPGEGGGGARDSYDPYGGVAHGGNGTGTGGSGPYGNGGRGSGTAGPNSNATGQYPTASGANQYGPGGPGGPAASGTQGGTATGGSAPGNGVAGGGNAAGSGAGGTFSGGGSPTAGPAMAAAGGPDGQQSGTSLSLVGGAPSDPMRGPAMAAAPSRGSSLQNGTGEAELMAGGRTAPPSYGIKPPPGTERDEMQGDGEIAPLDRRMNQRARVPARERGQNWALPGKGPSQVPIRRPIRVAVAADRFTLPPDPMQRVGQKTAKDIPLDGPTANSLDELVAAVHERVQQWDLAGNNMYWRPVLVLDVAPDGHRRADDLERLLKNSGLEIRDERAANLPPEDSSNAARRN